MPKFHKHLNLPTIHKSFTLDPEESIRILPELQRIGHRFIIVAHVIQKYMSRRQILTDTQK